VARKRRTRKRSTARRTTARRRIRRNPPTRYRRRGRVVHVRQRRAGKVRTVRRRSYRRNPGILSSITRGVMDALSVTGGKVLTNLGTRNLPALPLPGMAGDVVKGLAVATAVAMAASKFLGGDRARFVAAGAYSAVAEGVIRALNIPVVSQALGEYDIMNNALTALGSYARPAMLPAGVGSYPMATFEGDAISYDQNG